MKKLTLLAILAVVATGPAYAGGFSGDAVIGGAVGGATGAAIGSAVGGRDAAIIGGLLGGALGVAAATDDRRHYRGPAPVHYRAEPVYYRAAPEPVYYRPEPVYIRPEPVVYYQPAREVRVYDGYRHDRRHEHEYHREHRDW